MTTTSLVNNCIVRFQNLK